MRRQGLSKRSYAVRAILLLAGMTLLTPLYAQDTSSPPEKNRPSLVTTDPVKPELRTPEDMQEAESRRAPAAQSEIPFRPTMDPREYKTRKEQVQRAPREPRAPQRVAAPLVPPTLKTTNCDGTSQTTLFPPDTHGAVGTIHYVQIVNSQLVVYTKSSLNGDVGIACGPPVLDVSLATFFNYTTTTLFDPRVVFDHIYKRWIISAEAFPESGTVQRQFIAVSKTAKATGSYNKYSFDVDIFNNGDFWDFPQVGFDDTAILITANIFDLNDNYVGSRILLLSKHRMYNGLAVQPCFWLGGPLNLGTIAPPLVRDRNNETWFITAPPAGNFLRVTRWTATDRNCGIFLDTTDVPVGAYTFPPSAPQPGTGQVLDTSDARFVNASTQFGNFLYNIHSIDVGGAALSYYKIDVPAGAVAESLIFFSSGISSDFNASLAVNDTGNIYVTFSRSDSATFPEVRFAGKEAADPAFGLTTAFTSPSALTGNFDPNFGTQRWGDYSAITIDPSSVNHAWGVNERVNAGGGTWGFRIFRIGIP